MKNGSRESDVGAYYFGHALTSVYSHVLHTESQRKQPNPLLRHRHVLSRSDYFPKRKLARLTWKDANFGQSSFLSTNTQHFYFLLIITFACTACNYGGEGSHRIYR